MTAWRRSASVFIADGDIEVTPGKRDTINKNFMTGGEGEIGASLGFLYDNINNAGRQKSFCRSAK
jgi:hypothetical protein